MSLGKENQRDKVSFSPHYIRGTFYQYDLPPLMLTLIPSWGHMCPHSPLCSHPFLPLSIVYSLGGSPYSHSTLREWAVGLRFFEDVISTRIIWNFSAQEIPPFFFIYLFTFFILARTRGYLFYISGYNPVPFNYFVAQIVPILAIGRSFSCVPLTYPHGGGG